MKRISIILIGLTLFLVMLKTSALIICSWQVALFPFTALVIYLAFLFIIKYSKEEKNEKENKKEER